jgi:hypothetical protein
MRLEWRKGADLFGKRHGFNGGRQAKLGCQHSAAGFVDIQGGAALIHPCQHAHQLTIGGFAQRVVFEQTAYAAFGFSQLAGAFVKCSKLFQRRRHLHLDMLALREEPLVELQAVGEREFIQKIAPDQIERLCQPGGTFRAVPVISVRMETAGLD